MSSILVLLDLSADTTDHSILLHRLKKRAALSITLLDWITSYLSDRKFCVSVNNQTSQSGQIGQFFNFWTNFILSVYAYALLYMDMVSHFIVMQVTHSCMYLLIPLTAVV